jgi:penicillin-binding protein 1A
VQNFESANYGQMTVEQATIDSVNTVYAQLVMQTGVNNVVATAHKMGIESTLTNYPSVALGASDVNTLEMASAYGTLATEGYHTPPIAVTKITDASGKVIYQADPIPKAVINPGVAWTVDQILQKVVQEGTGIQANIGRPAGGKTGTTQNYHDAWFVGFVPQLVAAVWVGYPQGDVSMTAPRTRIPAVLGGTWPAEIWHAFMTNATADLPPLGFPQPDTRFVTVAVDVTRGCLPNEFTPPQEIQSVRFIAGSEPTVRCTEPTSPQQVPIPSVVGLSQDDAITLLESYGLVALVEPQEVSGLTPGTVLSQSPGSSTPAYPGNTVIIVVAVAPAVPPGGSPTPGPPPSGG